jgi:hypothetical protein
MRETQVRFRASSGQDFNIGRSFRSAANPSVFVFSVGDPFRASERYWWVLQSGQGAEEIGASRKGLAIATADYLDCFREEVDHKIGDRGHRDQEDRGVRPSVTPGQETLGPKQGLEKEWNRKNDRVQIEENNQSEQRQEPRHSVALFRPEARELPAFANVVPFRSAQDRQILKKRADVGNGENEKPGERFDEKSEWLECDLPLPDREQGGWLPPFGCLAGVHPDKFPATKRLQPLHPAISQSHRNRGRRAVVMGVAVVAHFCAKIEKREEKRDGSCAVKRINRGRRCPEELDGFLDQGQGRSTFNVQRSEFDVRHYVLCCFLQLFNSNAFGAERRTLNALLKVWWDENEKAANQVEEEPGDRQANDRDHGRFEPSRGPLGGFDWGGFPPKTTRAKKFSFMLSDAFPAEIVSTRRAAGYRFAIRMNQTPLKSDVHREISVKNGRGK